MFQLKPRFLATVSVGLLAAAAAAGAAAADTSTDLPSVVVRYSDLDLTTDTGQAALYRRLTHAAKTVCPSSELRDLGEFTRMQTCRDNALARALRAVGQPVMADRYLKVHSHG
jgi:UrcA family protein